MSEIDHHAEIPDEVPDCSFMTVCCEDGAPWTADGSRGKIRLGLKSYAREGYRAVRTEADRWRIRIETTESFDSGAYANLAEDHVSFRDMVIEDRNIIVNDGAFFGVLLRSRGRLACPRYACAKDHRGTPLRICTDYDPGDPEDIEAPSVSRVYWLVRAEDAENSSRQEDSRRQG